MISGVGPALVDRICIIDEYPNRGDQTIVKRVEKHAGGAAGNVIFGLASFGIPSRFFSSAGKDEDGRFYIGEMEKAGVECIFEFFDEETGRVDVYVDRSGERTFFVFPGASSRFRPFLKEEHYSWGEYFYLDPFPSENSLTAHLVIAKNAKKHGKTVILNPGHPYSKLGLEKLRDLLEKTDIVILSSHEYRLLEGIEDIVKTTVVTLGHRGSRAMVEGEEYYAEAFKARVVDTTGAGDAFSAGFIYAMIKGCDVEKCLKTGNFVASYNIQRIGARNFPDKRVVEDFIQSNMSSDDNCRSS